MRKLEPIEWRNLPENKRLDMVTKLYLQQCTTVVLYRHGKLAKDYFKIRTFFRSRPDDEVAKIYDYLFTLDEKVMVNLSDIYKIAEIHRKKLLYEAEQAKLSEMKSRGEIKRYAEITIDDILSM